VVVAQRDPFPAVAGGGIAELQAAGIEVEIGVQESAARQLNAPYLKLLAKKRPWVIAKWAMTLDGKIATRSGDSRWISSPASREIVHALRGRVDAIIVGRGTAAADDPLLTARPAGPRVAMRVVLDSQASISLDSQLVRTARETPVLLAVSAEAPADKIDELKQVGCEVFICDGVTHQERLLQLLDELGRRRLTNVLVEGGSQLLGSLFDAREIDEVHVFIAPKLIGGRDAPGPVAGVGLDKMSQALALDKPVWRQVEGDLYLRGRVNVP
jgi:diaminohydroxyphosphoribosylaminopyrimidine deaminase/5-amino-6-(5-phosphoribosylamino)uracil reductase